MRLFLYLRVTNDFFLLGIGGKKRMAVQGLRLPSDAGASSLIPGQQTKSPHAMWCGRFFFSKWRGGNHIEMKG